MKTLRIVFLAVAVSLAFCPQPAAAQKESVEEHDARMQWWRESRFGLFLHWGLYAVPAGEWKGTTTYGEWIRTSAQIPLAEYDRFVGKFNPVRFDARAWVRMAKDAGMKYVVITSKHHDGFCLFDSKFTDFDVMSTPFKRDILKELSEACRAEGLKMCWYHSIMDWHHPDYLPRREWEKDRPTEGASMHRYVAHMKNQLRELLTNYGPIGVLWFDGEWESTWTDSLGQDLYAYVRGLQKDIIINNRVGAGRSGMEGFTNAGGFGGDFGTPEQQVPATGLPGVDWETCMTMNDNWGYNSHDQHWKSSADLIRMLADIVSKGGNLLLNVGPTAEGLFPQVSVDRLKNIGAWMRANGEAIHGTTASPFPALSWGRCTQKRLAGGTRLYLHVFEWPTDGRLVVPGLLSTPRKASLLLTGVTLKTTQLTQAIVVEVPRTAPDTVNSVVVLEIDGVPDVSHPPAITIGPGIFVDSIAVPMTSDRTDVEIRYTTDGTAPTPSSPLAAGPLVLRSSATITAACFRRGVVVSEAVRATVARVSPLAPVTLHNAVPGVRYDYYEGTWDSLPAFPSLKPVRTGVAEEIALVEPRQPDNFGLRFTGFIRVPATGVYTFSLASDDGSRLEIGGRPLINNDYLHGRKEVDGHVALAAGDHPFVVEYFEKSGGNMLSLSVEGPGLTKQPVGRAMLIRQP
jgi:alpha-L-fucosidase